MDRGKTVVQTCCHPSKRCSYNSTKLFGICFTWLSILTLLVVQALPGSNFWGLCLVIMASMIGEEIAKKLRLPGLLGMIVAGFLLQNIPYINVARYISSGWSSSLRSVALVIIVLRAGLGLDISILRQISQSVLLLAFVPSTLESIMGAIASHYLLRIDWIWSFCTGFILCGVSPAVLIPAMLQIQEQGLGVEKGVPTLLIGASSLENAFCIQLFSILMSVGFATTNLTMQILQAPIELLISLVYGGGLGVLLWKLPHSDHPDKAGYRTVLLLGIGLTAVFGANLFKYPGAGPLSCLIVSFVAGYKWRRIDPVGHKLVADRLGKFWKYYQPVLFGLIGAAVSLNRIQANSVGFSIAVILIGSTMRILMTILVTQWTGFNWKERLFTAIAWFPKATVQAALGSKIVDFVTLQFPSTTTTATERATLAPADYDIYEYKVPEEQDKTNELKVIRDVGNQILAIAVLCIVLTAPMGALLIKLTKNRLLHMKTMSSVDGGRFTDHLAKTHIPARVSFNQANESSRISEDAVTADAADVPPQTAFPITSASPLTYIQEPTPV